MGLKHSKLTENLAAFNILEKIPLETFFAVCDELTSRDLENLCETNEFCRQRVITYLRSFLQMKTESRRLLDNLTFRTCNEMMATRSFRVESEKDYHLTLLTDLLLFHKVLKPYDRIKRISRNIILSPDLSPEEKEIQADLRINFPFINGTNSTKGKDSTTYFREQKKHYNYFYVDRTKFLKLDTK